MAERELSAVERKLLRYLAHPNVNYLTPWKSERIGAMEYLTSRELVRRFGQNGSSYAITAAGRAYLKEHGHE